MNWKLWLKGLGAAAANGAIGAVVPIGYNWATAAASGTTPPPVSGQTVGFMAAGAALIGVINYLVKSPRQDAPTTPAK